MTTLVLGATGKTGQRVAVRLADRGVPVRLGSRDGTPPFDWADQETWVATLDGVDSLYLSYYPDLAVPGAGEAVRGLCELAVASGVERMVLLSGRGEPHAQQAEQEFTRIVEDWTIVRCSWFNQNFSEGYLLEPVLAGEVAMPAGEVPEPFVDVDDIAEVAVAALTEDGHSGQLYELTGPRLLTFEEAVAEVSKAVGREIRFKPISMADYAAELAEYQLPGDLVWLLNHLFTEVLDGRNAELADGVQRALGREPKDFADFAREAAAAGAWDGC